jgi:hypothetical protein
MSIETKSEELKRRDDAAKRRGFELWMENPMTKALISTLPPIENFDMFRALLQACYQTGYDMGVGTAMSQIVEAMLKGPRNNA